MDGQNCGFDKTLISACVDSETTPEETSLVKEHILVCDGCRSDYFAFASARAGFLAAAGATLQVPAPRAEAIRRRIRIKIADAKPAGYRDIFEKYSYKLWLTAGMLLYLMADTFSPEAHMLFWLYFGFHLYVYSDKFDYRRQIAGV